MQKFSVNNLKANSHFVESVILFLCFGFSLGLNFTKVMSNDTWWHLEMGRWMVEHARVFTQEIYSVTAQGRPLMAHAWLSEVIFYLVADRDGVSLTWLKMVVNGLTLGGLYVGVFRRYWSDRFTFLVWLGFAYLISFQSEVRPQIFGMLCSAGLVLAIERVRTTEKFHDLLYFLPLQIFWANTHGSFLMAPFLSVCLAGFWLVWSQGKVWRQSLMWVAFALMLVGVSLINPYGVHLVEKAFRVFFEDNYMKQYIREWQGIWAAEQGSWHMGFWGYLWFVWIAASAWALGGWDRIREHPLDLALWVVAAVFPFTGVRHISLSAMLTLPGLLRGLKDRNLGEAWSQRARLGVLVPLLGFVWFVGNPQGPGEVLPSGVGFGYRQIPMDVFQHIKVHGLKGTMMNEYNDGGFVIYYLYPEVRTVMDSRTDTYGKELFEEHHQAYESYPAFLSYVDKYQADLVLVRNSNRGLRESLFHDPRWFMEKSGLTHDLFRRVYPLDFDPLSQVPPGPPDLAITKGPDKDFCLFARLFGQCLRFSVGHPCQKFCAAKDQELAQWLGLRSPDCLRYSQACFMKEGCGRCGDLCRHFGGAYPRLNRELGFDYPPPMVCGPMGSEAAVP